MKPRLALDTNCLIDLEEDRPDAVHLKRLITAWKRDRIQLAVIAVSASENQPNRVASSSFDEFEARLRRIGLDGVHHLLPFAVWDFGYWDHMLWASDEMIALEVKVRAVLFPGVQPTPPANPSENSKWRNQMCDVLVAWCCIHHQWEALVTRDSNFHEHKVELASLGLGVVVHPADAAAAHAN